MSNKIAYTDKMLATIFRMKEATVTMAIQTFEQFGMIETVDGVITIPNWGKHQTLDAYEQKKKRDRLYQQERRKKQRLLVSCGKSSDTSSDSSSDVAVSEEDKEKDKEKDLDKRIIKGGSKEQCEQVVKMFNSLCPSLPSIRTLSKTRISKLSSLFDTYSIDDFKELFELAEASDFLKGKNKKNWTATFDWLIDDSNIPKVLEGNYDNQSEDDVIDRIMLERQVAKGMEDKKKNPPLTAAECAEIHARMQALKEHFGQE
jgi:DNA-binding MarR family transcriptional regulator